MILFAHVNIAQELGAGLMARRIAHRLPLPCASGRLKVCRPSAMGRPTYSRRKALIRVSRSETTHVGLWSFFGCNSSSSVNPFEIRSPIAEGGTATALGFFPHTVRRANDEPHKFSDKHHSVIPSLRFETSNEGSFLCATNYSVSKIMGNE